MGVGKFVDIISSFANIGKNKEQSLREATLAAFDSHVKDGKYPSMKEIFDFAMDIEGDKQSTLRNILFTLSDYTIFETEVDPLNTFLDRNYFSFPFWALFLLKYVLQPHSLLSITSTTPL